MSLSDGIAWEKEFEYQKIDNNKLTVVGKVEFYPYQQPTWTPNPTTYYQLKPHLCPVCNGKGIVSGDFYISIGGYGTSTSTTVQCRSCQGKGIIWG